VKRKPGDGHGERGSEDRNATISRRRRTRGEHGSPSGYHLPDPDRNRHCSVGCSRRFWRVCNVRTHKRGNARDRNRDHRNPQPARHRRHSLPVCVAHSELHELHGGRTNDRGDDRRRRRRGVGACHGIDSKARDRLARLGSHLHPRLCRHHRQRCRRRGISGAHSSGWHRLSGGGSSPACRSGPGLRGGGRRFYGQHAHQASRCGPGRVHQRRGASRRSKPVDRAGLESLVLHSIGTVSHGDHRVHLRPHDRAAAWHLQTGEVRGRLRFRTERATLRKGIARIAIRTVRLDWVGCRLLPGRRERRCETPRLASSSATRPS